MLTIAIFKMTNIHEQRINIKFCDKLSKSFTVTRQIMQNAYGDQCCDWFKRFKDCRESVDDDPRSTSTDVYPSVDVGRSERQSRHHLTRLGEPHKW